MYTFTNPSKEKRAIALAKANGFSCEDNGAVAFYVAQLGGQVLDKDGVRVPSDAISLPKAKKEEAPEAEVKKAEVKKEAPKKKVVKKKK